MDKQPTSGNTLLQEEIAVLYNQSANGILILRKEGEDVFICRSCNPAICSMLNVDEKKLLGKPFAEIFADKTFEQLRQVFYTLENFQNGYPVFINLNGKQYKVVCHLIEQQSMVISFNERWRFSPVFYGNESLLNAIQDAIFIFDVGEDGKFRLNFLNQAHMDATGLDLARDAGKTPVEMIGEEDANQVIEHYQQCIESRGPIIYEEELYFPDRGESTWWQTQISPLIIDGKVIQIIGAARDITSKKKALDKIERLYLEYEALFNETAVPMWLADVKNDQDIHSIRLERYNPCYESVYGLAGKNCIGQSVEEHFIDPLLISRIYEKYDEVLQKREPISFEFELMLNDSKTNTMTTLTPIIRGEKIVKIIGSSLDITELRRYQDMLKLEGEMLMSRLHKQTRVLEESFEDQDDLLTSITIGYQEPLASVLGLVELLQEITSQNDSRSQILEQVQEQLEAVLQMMNTILLDSQISSEEVLRIHDFDVKAFTDRLIQDIIRDHPEYKNRLFFEDYFPMTMIWQDQQRTYRILQYLINKAFDRMTQEESLVLEGRYDPKEKAVLFSGRIDLSSTRYLPEDEEAYLQQFDQETLGGVAAGLDAKLIELMLNKVGGKLSYAREGRAARVTFHLPLIRETKPLQKQ